MICKEESKTGNKKICMLSIHGYVEAHPILGKTDTGGQVVFVLELSKNLSKLGFFVDIYTRQFEDQPQIEKVSKKVRIIRVSCGGRAFIPKEFMINYSDEFIENMLDYIKKHNLHYILINSHYWDAGFIGYKISKKLKIPHIHTPHSLGIWKKRFMPGNPQILEKRYNFKSRIDTETLIYKKADSIIATTHFGLDVLQNDYYCKKSKIYLIPPGFDPKRFFKVPKNTMLMIKRNLNLPKRYLFAVGRLAPNKGYDLLFKSMKYVFDRDKKIRLILAAGSSSPKKREVNLKEKLLSISNSLNITKYIRFRNYIPDEELPKYYQCSEVFLLSSRYEPFGMTVIEAMACGIPVVISSKGGVAKELRNNVHAVIANPEKPEEFANAVLKILFNKKFAQRIRANGYRKVHREFTWFGIARKTLKLYKNIIKSKGG